MVNGTLAHADETDDTLAPGPGIPAATSCPRRSRSASSSAPLAAQFLRAVVLGYDIGTRVMAAIQPGLQTGLKLPYGIAGMFGAAAAGGVACRLRSRRRCAGRCRTRRSRARASKPFRAIPITPRRGSSSAACPRAAASPRCCSCTTAGPPCTTPSSARESFVTAHAPAGKAELLVDRLGERFEITRANIKRWTVGLSHSRAARRHRGAAEAAADRSPAQITELVVRYQPGSITDNSGPSDINVQHALAVMLIDKRLTFRSVHDTARMRDPAVVRLRGRIRLVAPPPGGTPLRSRRRCCSSRWPTAAASCRTASGRCSAPRPIRCRASSSWPSAAR